MSSSEAKPASPSEGKLEAAAAAGVKKVSFFALFRFSTWFDTLLLVVALLCAAGNGVIFPCFTLIFGDLLNSFNSPGFSSKVNYYAGLFGIIGGATLFASSLEVGLAMISAERQVTRMRKAYLAALLRQPPAWHDTRRDAGEVASRLSEDMITIQAGIGEKMSLGVHYAVTFIAGLAVGFSSSWRLTLVILGCVPMLIFIIVYLKVTITKAEKSTADAYARAGEAATEAFSLIKTVAAYSGERAALRRYETHLVTAEKAGTAKGNSMGIAVGAMFGSMVRRRERAGASEARRARQVGGLVAKFP